MCVLEPTSQLISLNHFPSGTLPDELRSVWADAIQRWSQLTSNITDTLSSPFIACCFNEFHDSIFKTILFGQETFGWEGYSRNNTVTQNIEALLYNYNNFDLAENSPYKRTPFWQFHRHMVTALQESSYRAIAWLNIYKTDAHGSVEWNTDLKTREAIRKWQAGVIEAELRAYQPGCVVFATGPYYDEALASSLEAIKFEPVADPFGWNEREFARVRHPLLPYASFRTYHPGYLRRRGYDVVPLLSELIRSHPPE